VSEERFTIGQDVTVDNTADAVSESGSGFGHPAPVARIVPAVMFGLRTAALAGMVVSAGAVALGLSGVFDDSTNVAFTTCSGGENPEFQ
jgi:hypothetical protein